MIGGPERLPRILKNSLELLPRVGKDKCESNIVGWPVCATKQYRVNSIVQHGRSNILKRCLTTELSNGKVYTPMNGRPLHFSDGDRVRYVFVGSSSPLSRARSVLSRASAFHRTAGVCVCVYVCACVYMDRILDPRTGFVRRSSDCTKCYHGQHWKNDWFKRSGTFGRNLLVFWLRHLLGLAEKNLKIAVVGSC